jgi:predicted ArsR family transcriptional regulator
MIMEDMSTALRSTVSLRLVLRELLANEEVYGFELADKLGMEIATAYGILKRLINAGLVQMRDENLTFEERSAMGRPSRKYYSLTDKGRERASQMLAMKPLPI